MFSRTGVFHRSCFSCRSCRRPLDSVLACDGPDREIYCRGCYGKQFGARGYGFAGGRCDPSPLSRCQPQRKWLSSTFNLDICYSGFLQTGELGPESGSERPNLATDLTVIKAVSGDKDSCPRCGGKSVSHLSVWNFVLFMFIPPCQGVPCREDAVQMEFLP